MVTLHELPISSYGLYLLQSMRGDTLRIHLNIYMWKYFTLYATRHNNIL